MVVTLTILMMIFALFYFSRFHPSCMGMTIEEAKKLDRFLCSDCPLDDYAKRSLNTFPVSPSVEAKVWALMSTFCSFLSLSLWLIVVKTKSSWLSSPFLVISTFKICLYKSFSHMLGCFTHHTLFCSFATLWRPHLLAQMELIWVLDSC